MIRKLWLSCLIAALGVMLLAMGVFAQEDDIEGITGELEGPTVLPVTRPVTATTPFTLTVLIPGDDGPITVEVPIMLQLNMSISLGTNLTPTVATTPTVGIVGAGESLTDTEEIETIPVVTEETTPATPPTATPIATPIPTVAPTATPEALPTSTPITTAEEAVDETADETADETGDEGTEGTEATATPVPTAAPEETEEGDEEGADEGAGEGEGVTIAPVCPDSRSVITSPGVNQVVSGAVSISGTAVHENFQYYKIEYAEGADPDNTAEYAFLTDGRVQVSDGLLATFDSTGFANGTYTLRLSVVDNTGNFPPPCAVTVVIQN